MSAPAGSLVTETYTRTHAAGGLGTSDDGHTYTLTTGADMSVNGTRALCATPNSGVGHAAVVNSVSTKLVDQWLEVQIPKAATGGVVSVGLYGRYVDTNNTYLAQFQQTAAGTATLSIIRRKTGTPTTLKQITAIPAWSTSSVYVLRFDVTGPTGGTNPVLQAKLFLKSGGEPKTWSINITDTDAANYLTAAGSIGWQVTAESGNTSNPTVQIATFLADDLTAATPPPQTPALSAVTSPGAVNVPAGSSTSSAAIALSFASSTPPSIDHYTVAVDGGAATTQTSPYTITVALGSHIATVTAVGTDGQTTSSSFTWTYATSGTTTQTYTPVAGDVGYQIRALVTAINAQGASTPVATAWSPAVVAPSAAPINTTAPSISGSTSSGNTLASSPGVWTSNGPVTYTYQWKRAGSAIGGATLPTYKTVSADVGHAITCTVTATNSAGNASATTAGTANITNDAPTNTRTPGISVQDVFQVGGTLLADPGDWAGSQPVTITYQWVEATSAGGSYSNIGGATGQAYTLQPGDAAKYIEVAVTADNGF